ncbi:MAG TPA: zinc/manganese transporter permease [Gammaproteobacteria bacterium]|nr:zinc/manganese transporter permease [Gammaproteobacteria bacterium]
MMFDATLASILLPAMAAGLVVLSTHVPLGQEVLRRGIIFIDLAVAQIAAFGVLLAMLLEWDSPLAIQLTAISMALLGGLILSWTERRWPQEQEAIIGVSFILAASAGILLLANNPHGGEHLKDLLAGQILWVEWPQIAMTALVYTLLLLIWYSARQRIGRIGFYLLFAINVTLSVQLVGIYLVFATLILPSLATVRTPAGRRLLYGYLMGAMSFVAGLTISWLFDLPSGVVVTWMLAIFALLFRLFERQSRLSNAP